MVFVIFCILCIFTTSVAAQPRSVLISVNQTGMATGNNDSGEFGGYAISSNGRYVVFTSEASDLVANDTNGRDDVFRRDLATGETKLVSVNRLGTGSGNGFSRGAAISADGRYVLFNSNAPDLTNIPDSNLQFDVFVRDMVAEVTVMVSVNASGTAAASLSESNFYAITPNGRYVLFSSGAQDLTSIPDGNNLGSDVYVRDLQSGVTMLVSINSGGTASGNGTSFPNAISDDGRFVTFESLSSNLVSSGDNNSTYDVFLRDLSNSTTSVVSVNTTGNNTANGESRYSKLTPDGRFVVFASTATNVVNIADTNNAYDVFRRDVQTGATALISVNAAGTATGNRSSVGLGITYDISADGNLIAFESTASNLITNDINGFANDIFLRNVAQNTTVLISINRDGTGSGNGQSYNPRISTDGRYIAFQSLANNLVFVPDVTGGFTSDVFVRDTRWNRTFLLSYNKTGTATGNNSSFSPIITPDGRTAVFWSRATDLTEINDANGSSDVFISSLLPIRVKADFDDDGKTDISVFRPSSGDWYISLSSSNLFRAINFGLQNDIPVAADYDGDGRVDIAVFRDGVWYWLNSFNGSFNAVQFGTAGDVAVPADYSGDGRAELAVYRAGIWYTLNLASNQFQAVQFGITSDKPVQADYDGDGRTDFAVYRDGVWYWLRSRDNNFRAVQFGITSDKPVVGDYDGDLKADPAVYRSGVWYVLGSTQGFYAVQFGISSDIPVPADYDGDGKTDIAVYRDGVWYLLRSQQGFTAIQFGIANDRPIPAAYVP